MFEQFSSEHVHRFDLSSEVDLFKQQRNLFSKPGDPRIEHHRAFVYPHILLS